MAIAAPHGAPTSTRNRAFNPRARQVSCKSLSHSWKFTVSRPCDGKGLTSPKRSFSSAGAFAKVPNSRAQDDEHAREFLVETAFIRGGAGLGLAIARHL